MSANARCSLGTDGIIKKIRDRVGTVNPVYLSIDVDTIDPACMFVSPLSHLHVLSPKPLPSRFPKGCLQCSFGFSYNCVTRVFTNNTTIDAPATGTPETGGWSTRELRTILRGLEGLNFIGADIVEVAPAYDTNAELTTM